MFTSSASVTTSASTAVLTTALIAPAAHAYVNTMFESADPAAYGTLIQSLDVASTSYDFPFDTGSGRTNSGFKAEVLDPSTGAPLVPDFGVSPNVTRLVSEVFRVDTATTLVDQSGDLTLAPGDLVFSYSIQLTGRNTNTVETLREFTVTALDPLLGGNGVFDSTIVLGRGFSVEGLVNPTARIPVATAGDFTENPVFSSLDWQWDAAQADQLQNTEEISLLLFSRPATIVEAVGNFIGVPGQAVTGTDAIASNAPVLVPIPAPGTAALLGLAGLAAVTRRRGS